MVSVTSHYTQAALAFLPKPQPVASDSAARANPTDSSRAPAVVLASSASLNNPLANVLFGQQQKPNNILATLTQAKKGAVTDRKAAALQKLEQARERLRILRTFGGDPKAVAKEAKAIAQEIGDAAKEYGAAVQSEGGGDVSALASAPAAAATPTDPAAPPADASTATDQAAGHSADAAAADPGASPAVNGASAATAADGPDKTDGFDQKSSSDTASATPAGADADSARQKVVQAYQDAAAKGAEKSSEEKGNNDALEKFRDVARDAKQLIDDAARKLKAKNPADSNAIDAQSAKTSLDQDIKGLGDVIQAAQIEANAGDGGASSSVDVASPSVSVSINVVA
jgi:hypothetical protein